MIFIAHTISSHFRFADAFTLLARGGSLGTFRKEDISRSAQHDGWWRRAGKPRCRTGRVPAQRQEHKANRESAAALQERRAPPVHKCERNLSPGTAMKAKRWVSPFTFNNFLTHGVVALAGTPARWAPHDERRGESLCKR
ncbi:hypothetical protein DSL92_02060 [Billgrantia gudaonensis]|uniref:Uncharacterized protein n=1 Tax=Billgrantia gudaonensis TaxID=376427 RepID=A0A3S0NXC3_9GAMM|nr:hypothetical protein DSL92_02060 [Halomonas gudaonensis]